MLAVGRHINWTQLISSEAEKCFCTERGVHFAQDIFFWSRRKSYFSTLFAILRRRWSFTHCIWKYASVTCVKSVRYSDLRCIFRPIHFVWGRHTNVVWPVDNGRTKHISHFGFLDYKPRSQRKLTRKHNELTQTHSTALHLAYSMVEIEERDRWNWIRRQERMRRMFTANNTTWNLDQSCSQDSEKIPRFRFSLFRSSFGRSKTGHIMHACILGTTHALKPSPLLTGSMRWIEN